eukprot:g3531.t1
MKFVFFIFITTFALAKPNVVLDKTLTATHFWDCSGGACDATVVKGTSWQQNPNPLYLYAPQYSPMNPADYGGAKYGEQLWMTGAASDTLTDILGTDDSCCGRDSSKAGGCGKCVLVQNSNAIKSNWSAVVLKKNRCPPQSQGCEAGKAHLDMAVPGYDNLQWSLSNICGALPNTHITKAESTSCGAWWSNGSSTTEGCDCSSLPSTTNAQKLMKRGCELFTQWGWKTGNPTLSYTVVECPAELVKIVGNAFTSEGVQPSSFPSNPKSIIEPGSSSSSETSPSSSSTMTSTSSASITTISPLLFLFVMATIITN